MLMSITTFYIGPAALSKTIITLYCLKSFHASILTKKVSQGDQKVEGDSCIDFADRYDHVKGNPTSS
jgi:hypothetical protein